MVLNSGTEGDNLSRTNDSSPICRILPELLSTIFILCALDYHNSVDTLTLEVPAWVNVSYVCRHWREVALDCPALWAYHFVVSQRWSEELLARSKQAPLKARLVFLHRNLNSWSYAPVEMLAKHAGRSEELSLYLSDPSDRRVLDLFSTPAPYLRDLEIMAPPRSLSIDAPRAFFLPFLGDTPALRRLSVSQYPVPWYSFNLSSLTALELLCLPEEMHQDMVDFLATLSCMHGLTKLTLNDALGSATGFLSSAAFRTFQKIQLPHLAYLLISAPLSAVIALLSCVDIPLNALLRLGCFPESDCSLDDYTRLSSLVAQRFHISEDQAPYPTIECLTINFSMGTSMLLSTSLEDGFEEEDQYSDTLFALVVDWSQSMLAEQWNNMMDICGDICCNIPLTNVQAIRVADPPPWPAFWEKLLKDCSRLRCIKLIEGDMPDITSLLSVSGLTIHGDVEIQTRDHVLLPELEELELTWIEFLEGDPDPEWPCITQRALFDALATRTASRGRLTMTECKRGESNLFDMVCLWGDGEIHVESERAHVRLTTSDEGSSGDDFGQGSGGDREGDMGGESR